MCIIVKGRQPIRNRLTTGSLYHRNLITVSKLLKGQRSYNKKYLCSLWYSDYTNTHTLRRIELHNTYIQKPCALNFESWAELEKCRPCNFRAMFNNWGVTFEFYHYLFLSLKNIFFYEKRQDLNSFIMENISQEKFLSRLNNKNCFTYAVFKYEAERDICCVI